MSHNTTTAIKTIPDLGHLEDIKFAASKMIGPKRRAFQAKIALKYCAGNPRQTEIIFGWSRCAVELGLQEERTGIICLSQQSAFAGDKLWEEKHPKVAEALWILAQTHAQQDPTFRTTLSFTRLTALEAIKQLQLQGFSKDEIPCPSTMANVLNRNGYRLRPVIKAKPKKKIPETDTIFANIKDKDQASSKSNVMRISIDCKAAVNLGDYSRGGKTRGDNQALDHDMGCKEKYTPFGIVDEDTGKLFLSFGSSAKTSDFIADGIRAWWDQLSPVERNGLSTIQIKSDNGPESSGQRTQFLKRMVELADYTNKPIQLLYYPPYHSKYNPIERCWGILEKHWNGAKLVDVGTMIEWAKSMTWKGIHPIVELSCKVYKKGISLSREAMQVVESRLVRNPHLPKWDIMIQPVSMV